MRKTLKLWAEIAALFFIAALNRPNQYWTQEDLDASAANSKELWQRLQEAMRLRHLVHLLIILSFALLMVWLGRGLWMGR